MGQTEASPQCKTWKPVWILPTNTRRTPGLWEIRFSHLMRPQLKFLAWVPSLCVCRETRHCSSPAQYNPNSDGSIMLWRCYSAGGGCEGGTTTGCNCRKDECSQVQILEESIFQRAERKPRCTNPKKTHGCTSSKACSFYSILSKGAEYLRPCDRSAFIFWFICKSLHFCFFLMLYWVYIHEK